MVALLKALDRLSMAMAIACVALIMLIISVDAGSRYVLRAPIPWAFELLTYYLIVGAIYFSVSSTFAHGDHINIDLFQSRMSPVARARWAVVYSVLAGAVFALIAFSSGEASYEAWSQRQFLPGYIVWPAWLSHLPVVLGSALLSMRLLVHAATLFRRGEDPDVAIAGGEEA